MPRRSRLLDFEVDDKDVARVRRNLGRLKGKPLHVRLQRAMFTSGDLLARRMRAASPRQTGLLRRAVKARRDKRSNLGVIVGPTLRAPHRHLVIRGHRIVTPGGRYLGRRTKANPFVDRTARGFERKAASLVKREWLGRI